MSQQPRYVTSVVVEESGGAVTVTWGLGEVVPGPVEYFGYGVDYFGVDGNGGKRFGVRFHERMTGHVFEWESSTQANYEPESISASEDRIVAVYPDASIGLDEVGTISAFTHVNGKDVQTDLPVALLR